MVGTLRRSTSKTTFALLLLALSLALTAQRAAAFDGSKDSDKSPSDSAQPAAPTIASAAFSEAMKPLPESEIKGTLAHVGTLTKAVTAPPAGMPLPPRAPAVSTAPMTPGEKFKLFAKKSFFSPTPYLLSTLGGLLGETTDKDHGRHMTAGDFLADSGTHAARSFAFRATSNFFEKFAFATILRQDPRYHRSDKKSIGGKAIYAVTRVFVTQGDRCGCDQVNASFLMGGLAAAGVAQSWTREEDKSISKVFTSWASHIGVRAFTNLLSEFIGGQ
ncbi:MAG TPA: hypothetical protein VJZ91_16640 [Blastocatellia bacterium]|nr:hypothetical protein [Blastocatellia bacterium]